MSSIPVLTIAASLISAAALLHDRVLVANNLDLREKKPYERAYKELKKEGKLELYKRN